MTSMVWDMRKEKAPDLVRRILDQKIQGTCLEDLWQGSLMLKDIQPSMDTATTTITLVIKLISVERE